EADRGRDLVHLVGHGLSVDFEAELLQPLGQGCAALILARAGVDAVTDREDERDPAQRSGRLRNELRFWGERSAAGAPSEGRRHSPDLPPDFSSSRTSRIAAPRSTPLTMSYTVSAATEAAVSASISTPVWPTVAAVARIRRPGPARSGVIST